MPSKSSSNRPHIVLFNLHWNVQTAPGRESRLAVAKRLEGHVRERMAAVICALQLGWINYRRDWIILISKWSLWLCEWHFNTTVVENMSSFLLLLKNPIHAYKKMGSYPCPRPLPTAPRSLPTFTSQRHDSSPLALNSELVSLVAVRCTQPSAKTKIKIGRQMRTKPPSCTSFHVRDVVFPNIWRRSSREWIRMIGDFCAVLPQMVGSKHISGEDKYRSLQS